MKIQGYQIEGKIYFGSNVWHEIITIEFYLPLKHIQSLRIKSKFFPMEISKEITIQPTNAGKIYCKKITIKKAAIFMQDFFDNVGLDFCEKNDYNRRVLWMPYKIGEFNRKPKFKSIDWINSFIKHKGSKHTIIQRELPRKMQRDMGGNILQPLY
jgi:hypothetical protein